MIQSDQSLVESLMEKFKDYSSSFPEETLTHSWLVHHHDTHSFVFVLSFFSRSNMPPSVQ